MDLDVLHLSTGDLGAGAARGAFWLHQALLRTGVQSRMLVLRKASADPTILGPRRGLSKVLSAAVPLVDGLPVRLYAGRDRTAFFSTAWWPTRVGRLIERLQPRLLNLHWVGAGFLAPEDLASVRCPIVWTLRDMWPLTGGCHYAGDCTRFHGGCGACPQLGSTSEWDLSRWMHARKRKAWARQQIVLVAVSQWMAACAHQSGVFPDARVVVIPNALDETVFRPLDKRLAREVLGLDPERPLILFGAINPTVDKRKGGAYLQAALQQLDRSSLPDPQLLIFGATAGQSGVHFGSDARYLGYVHDDRLLALVYSAADVTLVPSTEEAFGKTAMESMACGTPVVSFDIGGLKDIVDHQLNGYRARAFEPGDLAAGIRWVLEDGERWLRLSENARHKVLQRFTFDLQAGRYRALYQECLAVGGLEQAHGP